MSMGLLPLLLVAVITTVVNKQVLSDRAFSQLESARKIKRDQIQAYVEERRKDLDILMDTVDSLRQSAFDKLQTVQENKKAQILTYYHKTARDLEVLSKSITVTRALKDFHSVINEAGEFDSLLYNFFESEKYGDTLVKFRDLYNYHDLLLVTPKGWVVYASRRGAELGQNLKDLPLSHSLLAHCFKQGMTQLAYTDFSAVSNGSAPYLALFGMPVLDKAGRVAGVVILKITPDAINEIMRRKQGMGETGETYLSIINENRAVLRSSRHLTGGQIGDPIGGIPDEQELFRAVKPIIRITKTKNAEIAIYEPIPVFGTTYLLSSSISLNEVIDPRFQDRDQDFFSKYIQAYGYDNLYLISPSGEVFYAAASASVLPDLFSSRDHGLLGAL